MRCDAFDYVIWNAINQFDVDVILRHAGSFTHITIPHATFIIMLQNIKVDNPITYPEITTSIPLDGAIIGTRNIVSILLDKCFFHVKFSGGNEYKKMFDSAFTAMTIYTGLIEILNMRYWHHSFNEGTYYVDDNKESTCVSRNKANSTGNASVTGVITPASLLQILPKNGTLSGDSGMTP